MTYVPLPRLCEPEHVSYELEKFGIKVGADRIRELAEAGYMPCYSVDGGEFRFVLEEAKLWIRNNLMVRGEPRKFPRALPLVSPKAEPALAAVAPKSLAPVVEHLWEIPVSVFGIKSAIYFFAQDREVVYVGQSVALFGRLASHVDRELFEFDRIFYMHVPDSELNVVEAAFIRILQPRYNASLKSPERPGDRETLQRLCGAEAVEMVAELA